MVPCLQHKYSVAERSGSPGTEIVVRSRAGNVVALAILMLTVLFGFCSLAVDYGRVQTAKTELQRTADAAARAAVRSIATGISAAQSAATSVAAANTADNANVVLASEDIEFGTWDSSARTFTVLSGAARSGANAIRVTARKENIPLYFASTIGMSNIDVDATAIARIEDENSAIGFVALEEMEFSKDAFVGSYDSSVTTSPTTGTSTGNALVSSNGEIKFKKNSTLDGDALLGPNGELNPSNLTMTGTTTTQGSDITVPASPSWSPAANPGGIAQNYTVNSNTTLSGGTYWFTSLNVKKQLTFSGPATLYVNGNIDIDDPIVTHGSLPANLKIYQLGSDRKFDIAKETTLTAQIHAPGSKFNAKKELVFHGSMIIKSLKVAKNADMFVDESSTDSSGGSVGGAVCIVE
jgi:Flp pilus assembly protein TadG